MSDLACPLLYDWEGQEPNGWVIMNWVTYNGKRLHRHILPCSDLRSHQLDPTCWCKPRWEEDEDRLLVHNSADGRELFERGEARPS